MSRRAKELIEKLEPCVLALGYELVDLEYNSSPLHGLLRIYIDSPDGVSLEDCEMVSHQVSGVLDVEDLIKGQYNLEISSPGLDRILRTVEHYQRFIGEQVLVQLKRPQDGQRKFKGLLVKAEGDEIVLRINDQDLTLTLANIMKTRLVPVFA